MCRRQRQCEGPSRARECCCLLWPLFGALSGSEGQLRAVNTRADAGGPWGLHSKSTYRLERGEGVAGGTSVFRSSLRHAEGQASAWWGQFLQEMLGERQHPATWIGFAAGLDSELGADYP